MILGTWMNFAQPKYIVSFNNLVKVPGITILIATALGIFSFREEP